jgi:hypothetical protein
MNLLNFNSNNKSWKVYTNTLTSIANDDLLIKPNNTNDLILEVSANNNIILKRGDISYSINTKFDTIDTSFNDVYSKFTTIDSSFNQVNTKFFIIDASFNNKLASISGSIVPLNDISYNLGSDTKRWANAYIRDISVTNISASGNIVPLFNLSGSLGVSDRTWLNAYIRDLSGVVNINGQPYGSGTGTIDLTNVTSNINPSINNNGSLGIATRKWGNAFIRDLSVGSIEVSVNLNPTSIMSGTGGLSYANVSLGVINKRWGNAYIRDLSVNSIDVSVNINPLNNNKGSLGTILKRWGNAYIRDLSVSSIDVTVNLNPLITNMGSLGIANNVWGNAFIGTINATSITISGSLLPLSTLSLGTSAVYTAANRHWGEVAMGRTFISSASTGNAWYENNGVGILILNTNPSIAANQRAILFTQSSFSSVNSRAGIALEISGKYGWQISVRQNTPDSGFVGTLFFNSSSRGTNATDAVRFTGTGTMIFAGTLVPSDDRLKHNEIIINNGLAIIDQLVPKFYQKTLEMLDANYNGDLSGYTWFYEAGLIAQELLQIKDISFVVQDGDYYDSSNILIKQPYIVNYTNVFIYGLVAIKELHAKVKAQDSIILNLQATILNQQTTINSLIAEIEALENKI